MAQKKSKQKKQREQKIYNNPISKWWGKALIFFLVTAMVIASVAALIYGIVIMILKV